MLTAGFKSKIRELLDDIATIDLRTRLMLKRGRQKPAFDRLRRRFADYANLRERDDQEFLTPMWENYDAQLRMSLLPHPPFGFQRDQSIAGSMVFNPDRSITRAQLSFIEATFPDIDLPSAMLEDPTGRPPLFRHARYLTSPNTIHHVHHVARFVRATNVSISNLGRVIEWGGGYGNLAKVFSRLGFTGTYTIIDLPLLSALQWLYLSSVIGEKEVSLQIDAHRMVEARFVLLPLHVARNADLNADLFISTWALSESSPAAQDWVSDSKSWFGAKNHLIAFQEGSEVLPHAGRIEAKAKQADAIIESIELQPGNYYAFR